MTQSDTIAISAAEAKALLYGVPKHEFTSALSRIAAWLAEVDDTMPATEAYTPSPQPNLAVTEPVDLPDHFENWWASSRFREAPAERYSDRKQLAWDAYYAASQNHAPVSNVDGWNAHEEFKRSALAARQAFDHVVGKPTRLATVGKHEARNLQHLKGVYEAALEQSPEFADTLAWLLWWEIAKFDRLAELTQWGPAPEKHVVPFAMSEAEIRQWIEACNHEPARATLRHYLALRVAGEAEHAKPPCLQAEPLSDEPPLTMRTASGVSLASPAAPSQHLRGDPVDLKPIPIEAAKRIAKEYGYDQVLIYARRCHDTPEPHGEHMTTYGRNREHCDVAARIGDTLKKFMGWEV